MYDAHDLFVCLFVGQPVALLTLKAYPTRPRCLHEKLCALSACEIEPSLVSGRGIVQRGAKRTSSAVVAIDVIRRLCTSDIKVHI